MTGFDDMRSAAQAYLMEAENTLFPLIDSVENVKRAFVDKGWSEENAETAALVWMRSCLGVR